MQDAGTSRRDAVIAMGCVLALHAWLGWGLNRLLGVAAAPPAADALQVVWIEPRGVRAIAPPPGPSLAPRRSAPAAAPRVTAPAAPIATPPTPATAAPQGKPLSVVLLGQARQWARQQAPVAFAGADALAERAIALPGKPADRFRMTTVLSPAEVVGLVGMAFGAGPDPCIGNRENIAAYATGRDGMALELALDFERHCRP